ncbi:MAG: DEAD/DEAH box helicase family protein [Leadbetterella sp.]|nr:DEAD/DEAH box helicase family protein [Leadbetterella sp.]
MAEVTKELHLEEHILKYLSKIAQSEFPEYTVKDNSCYDKDLCLIPEDLICFIKETQPKKYDVLSAHYGPNTDSKIVELVADNINKSELKTLQVLREKEKDSGQYLYLIYFKPSHSKTLERMEGYLKNKLTVIRQLKYSKKNEKSIDIVLFVNGLPVVTMELKNALTGQYLHNDIKQCIQDRDPKEPLLEFKRCLVHFAIGSDYVSMCTELKGRSTYFLPFNQTLVNQDDNNYATSYFWKDVLRKDSLLDIIQNYVNLQINKEKYYDNQTKALIEKEKPVLIFPRFHQRRAVQNLLEAVRKDGVGNKYLIQHSAGSGKSNTISWLVHRLSDFYRHPDDEKALYNSVIVVSDRRLLDKQIQDSIRQFEQMPSTVEYIDKNKTSQDLKNAIEKGKRVIVTTLQKFPVISDVIAQNKDKTYAVIIDEAHSSQAGESARHLRKALSLEEAENADGVEKDFDDLIVEEIKKKGDQDNISFFAFTATPNPKTLELFGTIRNSQKEAFDLYTMEQAIKEGFIKDVLKNYMSWKRYYKLIKRNEIADKEYEKKKTVRLLSSYVDLQDHAVEKKVRIMIEHFVSQTQNEIQGQAKAMVVTRSRLHAVRFKRKFDDIMREMKLPYGALVAFSGTVTDGETGQDYTKENMNNLGGKIEIPDALKLPKYRILIVANMYQTDFDEPLLHTMFVDKKLGGTSAVQTLSRLNRTAPGKDTTMVLDFVNDPEKVQEDFQMYYGSNCMELDDQKDSNSLYDVQQKIEAFNIIYQNDIEAYADLFFTRGDHKEKLQPILNAVVNRYSVALNEDQKVSFNANIKIFVRLYRFLSQIITFTDVQLEKYYVFLSDLFKKLPASPNTNPTEVPEEIDLDSYKLQYQFKTDLALQRQNTSMEGMTPGGDGKKEDEELEWQTNIIKVLNDTYGLDLKEEERVDFDRMRKNIYANNELMSFFNTRNSKDNIQDKFNEEIDNELLDFINSKLELYNKLSEDKVNLMFKRLWFNEIYDQRVRGILK